MAATRPTHGLPLAYVVAAAVNAPASIIPSSAMLMTPDRSENKPPSAARMSGVERRIVEKINAIVKRSAIGLLPPKRVAEAEDRRAKKCFRRDEQDNRRLQNLDDVLCDVLREGIDGDAATREHREQQRREDDPDGMIAAKERDRNPRKAIAV